MRFSRNNSRLPAGELRVNVRRLTMHLPPKQAPAHLAHAKTTVTADPVHSHSRSRSPTRQKSCTTPTPHSHQDPASLPTTASALSAANTVIAVKHVALTATAQSAVACSSTPSMLQTAPATLLTTYDPRGPHALDHPRNAPHASMTASPTQTRLSTTPSAPTSPTSHPRTLTERYLNCFFTPQKPPSYHRKGIASTHARSCAP